MHFTALKLALVSAVHCSPLFPCQLFSCCSLLQTVTTCFLDIYRLVYAFTRWVAFIYTPVLLLFDVPNIGSTTIIVLYIVTILQSIVISCVCTLLYLLVMLGKRVLLIVSLCLSLCNLPCFWTVQLLFPLGVLVVY